ncbi:hypothetical protein [Salinicola avicenniae]|uniref:hypothetical protein n=1 Tax=Salinicola avicenniae TaxID=2916836 RepID=UPI0020730A6E|nr:MULTISPECIES: hypothetical protein [unclassified Salinicola]
MRMMDHELARTPMAKRNRRQPGSLASLAEAHDMPVGTLKSRVKALVDSGVAREEAIARALARPINRRGRPRT